MARIITSWFLGQNDQLTALVAEAQSILDQARDPEGNYINNNVYLDLALLAAAEGDTEAAQRLIRRWQRGTTGDITSLLMLRQYARQELGMAIAAAAAVDCLGTAFEPPSLGMPFLEPDLPYYDSIRDDPQFVELQTEIDDSLGTRQE